MTAANVPQMKAEGSSANDELRILLISNTNADRTTGRLMISLAKLLERQGHLVRVQLRALPRGVLGKILRLARDSYRTYQLVRSVDLVFVHTPVALSWGVIVLARALGRPVLAFVWDVHPESSREGGNIRNPVLLGAFWLLEHSGYAIASRLLIPSEDYRPFLGRFGHDAAIVPMWPSDPINATQRVACDDGTLRIGFAGQINSIRGVDEGVEEVVALWQGHSVELHIFSGNSCPDSLHRRSYRDGRLKIVERGFLGSSELQGELANLDLGWVCLDRRLSLPAFPSKILAYLCAGLPVLYTGPEQPALQNWLAEHQLGLATSTCGFLTPEGVSDLRSGFDERRREYLYRIQTEWIRLDPLL